MKIAIISILIFVIARSSIYNKYYNEAFKLTQAMTIDQKIGQTLQAQFTNLQNKGIIDNTLALKYFLGSVLVAGDGVPDSKGNIVPIPTQQQKAKAIYLNGTLENWQALAFKFNQIGPQVQTFEGKRYKIKLLLGTDAVHNNQHVIGTIIFPHNIGLSCTHNPNIFYNLGYWTGFNVKNSGFNYAFSPTVAVSHNPQWGRYYESMGQQDKFIYSYAKEYIRGLQNIDNVTEKWGGVVGSVKHFFGDGSTLYGADQGNSRVYSMKSYIDHNTQGYKGAIESQVGTVMVSYSAINGVPNSINPSIHNILRNKLKFDGLVISDYDQMNRISYQQLPTSFINMSDLQAYSTAMNAGIDMFMLAGYNGNKAIPQIISNAKISLLQNNTVDIDRLNDAVTRILSVKMSMGLIQLISGNQTQQNEKVKQSNIKINSENQDVFKATQQTNIKISSQYQDSLQAVRESLVLLKNQNVLPIKNIRSEIQYIVLVGERVININHLSKNQLFRSFDDIGMQCGGWTLRWQGFEGNELWVGENKIKTNATSILDGLKNLNGNFQLLYPNYTTFTEELVIDVERTQYLNKLKTLRKNMTAKNTIIIGVLGQAPYAEVVGDVNIPYCKSILGGDGCLYDSSLTPYLPEKQRTTLEINYEKFDENVISSIRQQDSKIPLITILVAGRPMIVNSSLTQSSAFIAAWLPGTSGGQGIVDAISGDYIMKAKGASDRTNTLSMDWPSNMQSLANFPVYGANGEIPRIKNPLFQVGHGLSTTSNNLIDIQ